MQQLKIAQNNIYEKVINNLLNNITGQQAAYIISKVPDYFQLLQQGELNKNKDLKIKKSQDNKIYKKFKELQSGYNKLRKNIKASNEEYKIQQQARYQQSIQKKNEKIQKLQQQRKQKAIQEQEQAPIRSIFDEEIKTLVAGKKILKEVSKDAAVRNTYKHQVKKINGLEEHNFRLKFEDGVDDLTTIINDNSQQIETQLRQVQQRNNFPFKIRMMISILLVEKKKIKKEKKKINIIAKFADEFDEQQDNVESSGLHTDKILAIKIIPRVIENQKQSIDIPHIDLLRVQKEEDDKINSHLVVLKNFGYLMKDDCNRIKWYCRNCMCHIYKKKDQTQFETIGQAPIGVRAAKIKIKSRAATIKATPQGRTKTNEKEQQQEENKKIHKEVSRNHFIRK
ncbi:hypothetical protein ABPG72_012096 [Tetrahymena utriculariae]